MGEEEKSFFIMSLPRLLERDLSITLSQEHKEISIVRVEFSRNEGAVRDTGILVPALC